MMIYHFIKSSWIWVPFFLQVRAQDLHLASSKINKVPIGRPRRFYRDCFLPRLQHGKDCRKNGESSARSYNYLISTYAMAYFSCYGLTKIRYSPGVGVMILFIIVRFDESSFYLL